MDDVADDVADDVVDGMANVEGAVDGDDEVGGAAEWDGGLFEVANGAVAGHDERDGPCAFDVCIVVHVVDEIDTAGGEVCAMRFSCVAASWE